jgi:hypothetical protein
LKIGCQRGEMSKWKHEPLKVNFPPFLGGARPQKNWWNSQIADVNRVRVEICEQFMRLYDFWAVWPGLNMRILLLFS